MFLFKNSDKSAITFVATATLGSKNLEQNPLASNVPLSRGHHTSSPQETIQKAQGIPCFAGKFE